MKKRFGLLDLLHRFASARGFLWLAAIVFVFEAVNLANGNWGKDAWEHHAVISELREQPFHPDNPIISGRIPHAFFSPYSVWWGFIGKITGLDVFTLLMLAGFINLVLLLWVLRFFVYSLYRNNRKAISFYLLLFILFSWGPAAWRWSSFYHITALHYVLPYPSTFAFVLSLLAVSLYIRLVSAGRKIVSLAGYAAVSIFAAVVLLTHPTTFIFLACSLMIFSMDELLKKRDLMPILLPGGLLIISLLMVSFWPYYPFWDLVLDEASGSQFHQASAALYDKLLIRLLPVWIAFPFLLERFRKNRRDGLSILFVLLVIVYLYGLISGNFGYGRVIFFIVFVLHLVMAESFANIDLAPGKWRLGAAVFLLLSLPFLMFHSPLLVRNSIPSLGERPNESLEELPFLLKGDPVVLTDTITMRYVPAYGGKVIASMYPAYWIEDNESRKNDIKLYFSEKANSRQRLNLLQKYKVAFILLHRSDEGFAREADDFSYGVSELKWANKDFVLLQVREELLSP